MATGRLGAESLAATTNTTIYTVPSDIVATVTVNICNRDASSANVRIALIDGDIGSLSDKDYIEYDTEICAGGVIERSGIAMGAGQTIVAYSSNALTTVQVWGWEEPV